MGPDKITLTHSFAEIAANTSEVWYVPQPHEGTYRLKAAYFTSWTARTADDTNYTDISLEKAGTEIASEATTTGDTGDLVAGTAIALALTKVDSNIEFAQGSSITIKKTDSGTGLALDGTVSLALEKVH